MYKRILVPTDGSEITAKAVDMAIGLAKLTGASLVAISITEPFPYTAMSEMQPVPPREFQDAQIRMATGFLQAIADRAKAQGVNAVETLTKESSSVWEAIVEEIKAHGADLVVMASHGRRGVSALLLGSETQKVLTHCSVPVLVVR